MKLRLKQNLENISLSLLNWVYPKRCISCKGYLPFDDSRHLCRKCSESIQIIQEPYCIRCGVHLPDGGMRCYSCKHDEIYFDCVRCFGIFEGPLREMIHHFKYRKKDYLDDELSYFLFQAWDRFPELQEFEIMIPVPLHSSSLRERGYNQSQLLATKFLNRINNKSQNNEQNSNSKYSLLKQVLIRTKKTVSQTLLKKEERATNIESAFKISEPELIKGKNILLIDDVCTTGATLNECAKILRKSGAKKVLGLTLARD